MMSGISGSGSYGASPYARSAGQRPDPAAMQQKLFKKIDGDSDGSVSEAEFTAFTKNAPKLPEGVTAPSFSDMDSDGDGKLSQSEFSEGSKKLEEQLHSQFESLRAAGGKGGPQGMPPPGGEGEGLSKDDITSLAGSTGSSNATASGKLADLAENFDTADTNQDGKVSIEELLAYEDQKDSQNGGKDSTSSQKISLHDKLQNLVLSLLGDGQDRQVGSVSVSA